MLSVLVTATRRLAALRAPHGSVTGSMRLLGTRAARAPETLSTCWLRSTPVLTGAGAPSAPLSARPSSSLAGVETSGLPRMERGGDGWSSGLLKGGKGRKSLGGVLAITNTWNNTLISISNSSYKQLGFVSAGVRARWACRVRRMPTSLRSSTCAPTATLRPPIPSNLPREPRTRNARLLKQCRPHPSWCTGSVGFKKSKRSSQFATERTISEAFSKARALGVRRVMISMRGPAVMLRKPLFKQLREESGLRIVKLRMADNVPHGGCRPRKSRRRRWKTKARKR